MILDIELEKWQGGHLSPFQTEGCQLQLKDWGRFQIQATDSNTKFDKLNVLIFEHWSRPCARFWPNGKMKHLRCWPWDKRCYCQENAHKVLPWIMKHDEEE